MSRKAEFRQKRPRCNIYPRDNPRRTAEIILMILPCIVNLLQSYRHITRFVFDLASLGLGNHYRHISFSFDVSGYTAGNKSVHAALSVAAHNHEVYLLFFGNFENFLCDVSSPDNSLNLE